MTTKGLLRKQIIIPIGNNNISNFMKNSSLHVTNINRTLRNAKSEVLVDFIHSDSLGIMIVTNKVSLQSDLQLIEKYVKSSNDINALQVKVLWLLQLKSYLKIIDITLFPHGNVQERFTPNNVETIIKQNYIFDNITLASKPHVIKVSSKSDMVIIWINIWDIQSGSKAKTLINQCFNVGKFIMTVRGANINPRVPQCKDCWKWGHFTFSCRIQEAKYVKCNRLHKSENHCEFGWCCKANSKMNPPRLETKKGKLCPHSFKCSNCWGDHQADSNSCPFWRHRFNRDWH